MSQRGTWGSTEGMFMLLPSVEAHRSSAINDPDWLELLTLGVEKNVEKVKQPPQYRTIIPLLGDVERSSSVPHCAGLDGDHLHALVST